MTTLFSVTCYTLAYASVISAAALWIGLQLAHSRRIGTVKA